MMSTNYEPLFMKISPFFGAHGSVAVKALSYKVADSKPDEVNVFNLPNPSGPGDHSASIRNQYQKQKNNVSVE
jgi:hypothetical protein